MKRIQTTVLDFLTFLNLEFYVCLCLALCLSSTATPKTQTWSSPSTSSMTCFRRLASVSNSCPAIGDGLCLSWRFRGHAIHHNSRVRGSRAWPMFYWTHEPFEKSYQEPHIDRFYWYSENHTNKTNFRTVISRKFRHSKTNTVMLVSAYKYVICLFFEPKILLFLLETQFYCWLLWQLGLSFSCLLPSETALFSRLLPHKPR